MKQIKLLSLAFIFCVTFIGCDRSFQKDIISTASPELDVFVRDSNRVAVEGAEVLIYRTEEDFNNQTDPIMNGNTDDNGKVTANEEVLQDPGNFYIRASKGGKEGSGKTPYILLTDGVTYFDVIIQ
ncbi:MAG: hypothetical protein PVI44_10460 [Balneolaceae bacterium]